MKNLELQNYGVATLSAREMRDTNGGYILGGIIIVVVCGVIADWENFKGGLSGKMCK